MSDQEIITAVTQIAERVLGSNYQVELIGSRKSGTARSGSDYDFLVSGPEPLTLLQHTRLRSEADALMTLATIDFVDAKTASSDFLATLTS